ncbi:MAG: diguanylate cyclase [Acidobacteria bacterium]|nr:diguanylate cyclase [Acidobacteriota bacterium]
MTDDSATRRRLAVPETWHPANVRRRLIEPPESIREPEQRRRARLLSTLLVIPMLLGMVALILASLGLNPLAHGATELFVPITLVLVTLVPFAYGLSRTRHFTAAAALTVGIVIASTFVSVIIMPEAPMLLAFTILGVLVSGLFLSTRTTVAVFVSTIAGILLLPAFLPDLFFPNVVMAVLFSIAVGALIVVATTIHQRDQEQIEEQSRALAESEQRFRTVVTSAEEAIITADSRGTIVAWNRGAAAMFGHREQDAAGRPLSMLMPERYARAYRRAQERLLAGLPPPSGKTYESYGLRRDGSEFPLEYSLASWRAGDEAFLTVFVRDITERKAAEAAVRRANEQLRRWVRELEERNREMSLLGEMGEMLQACHTLGEAHDVIARYAETLFAGDTGAVYVLATSPGLVERIAAWGDTSATERVFSTAQCWALRRGRVHLVHGPATGPSCQHLGASAGPCQLCVPLTALGEVLGLIHLQYLPCDATDGEDADRHAQSRQRLAVTVAEQLALSLANLRLRETLQDQSIRDALTGLYNRRYMEETLDRELLRARRSGRRLGLIMLDVDHFKRFNDTLGHAAGDALVRQLGAFLATRFRGDDVACRYGGDEFTLILPEAPLEVTRQRAEEVRNLVRGLEVQLPGDTGPTTVSLGIAVFPDHGMTRDDLVRAADAALYRAKLAGRNRVEAAEPTAA